MEEYRNNAEDRTAPYATPKEEKTLARTILLDVYYALNEKGYNPLNQLVGYLLSGEPAYITSHRNARSIIKKVERDELLEELVKNYIKTFPSDNSSDHENDENQF